MKLPEIASGAGILKKVSGRHSNENKNSNMMSLANPRDNRDSLVNAGAYLNNNNSKTEERKDKLKRQLERINHIKMQGANLGQGINLP